MDVLQPNALTVLDDLIRQKASDISAYTKHKGDFTRNRKLNAFTTIKTTLNMQGNSLNAELLDAFPVKDERMTASAFEQAKDKLTPQVFEDLFHEYNNTMAKITTLDVVNSYRVYATDGSDFNPPYVESSDYAINYNKGRPRKNDEPAKPFSQVHGNLLYNLMDRTYQDAILQPKSKMDEREAAIQMFKRLDRSTPFIGIMDRGYDGFNMIENLNRIDNCYYILRTKAGKGGIRQISALPDKECDTDMEFEVTTNQTYYLKNKDDKPFLKYIKKCKKHYKSNRSKESKDRRWDFEDNCKVKVRVVKFRINDPDTGKEEWEVLITNLNKFEFPLAKMKELYALRWGIETSFRELKYAIGAIQFHSKKDDFVQMELFAHFTIYNAVSRNINAVSVPQKSENKHKYALDFKMACMLMRKYMRLFNTADYNEIYEEMLGYLVPVRPDKKNKTKVVIHKPITSVWFCYRVA